MPLLLLVDDDPALLQALESYLAKDFDVIACNSFEEGKRMLTTRRPDALVTDVRLGAFNGLQLAVMARDQDPSVRIVVFSGFDDPVLREEARRLGASYVVKPVSGQTILQELQSK